MAGGYREGSGRSKHGYYKGIYCGSTYELCWVIYNLDHNIIFSRFPGFLEKDGIKYYPDFLLADNKTIIETKGFENKEKVDKKTKIAEEFGYIVNVLYKEDLQFIFDYVEQNYGTKKFYTLYDEYKPKYIYTCSNCETTFETDTIKNTEVKFCGRSCSGKYRNKVNLSNDDTKRKISETLTGKSPKPYKRKFKYKWINNGLINTRIKEGNELPDGFIIGYIIKK